MSAPFAVSRGARLVIIPANGRSIAGVREGKTQDQQTNTKPKTKKPTTMIYRHHNLTPKVLRPETLSKDALEELDLHTGRYTARKLTKLFGRPIVLVPVYPRAKIPRLRRFQRFTLELMDDPQYLACIGRRGCNVAVLLGSASGNLCTLDFDEDRNAEAFLAENPWFRSTLATTARRGRNLWFFVSVDRPRSFDVKADEGGETNVVEFRADGRLTLIAGTHPSGFSYRLLVKARPITVQWQEIKWPEPWRDRVERLTQPRQPRAAAVPRQNQQANAIAPGALLDRAKLENVAERADGSYYNARCPACSAAGGDTKGNHLSERRLWLRPSPWRFLGGASAPT